MGHGIDFAEFHVAHLTAVEFVGLEKRIDSIWELPQVPEAKTSVKEHLPVAVIQLEASVEQFNALFVAAQEVQRPGKLLQVLMVGRVEETALLKDFHALLDLALDPQDEAFEIQGVFVVFSWLLSVFQLLDQLHALVVLMPRE